MKKSVYIFLLLIAILIVTFLVWKNSVYTSKLIEINSSSEIDLKITKAYNERGIYILNDSIYIGENEIIKIDTGKIKIEDEAIWRPKGSKFVPRISDISAPFYLKKLKNENTFLLVKESDTIIFKLK